MSNPSGIPSATVLLRRQLGLPEAGRLVLYAGRFAADHPLELLMTAAPYVMDQVRIVHFVLIGDGPTRRRLEAEARARSLDAAIIFAGDVAPSDIRRFATACDVGLLISQSVGSSVRGFAVEEIRDFLDAGRPVVVASDVSDTCCFVQANNIGSAIRLTGNPAADAAGLVRSLSGMLANDRLRQQRGDTARRLAKALQATRTGGALDIVRATLRHAASL